MIPSALVERFACPGSVQETDVCPVNSKDFIEGSWMVLVAQDMGKRIVMF